MYRALKTRFKKKKFSYKCHIFVSKVVSIIMLRVTRYLVPKQTLAKRLVFLIADHIIQ